MDRRLLGQLDTRLRQDKNSETLNEDRLSVHLDIINTCRTSLTWRQFNSIQTTIMTIIFQTLWSSYIAVDNKLLLASIDNYVHVDEKIIS